MSDHESIVLYEDWNEREDGVYYRWRRSDEKKWHERLTPYKQKPIHQYKILSREEYLDFAAKERKKNTSGGQR